MRSFTPVALAVAFFVGTFSVSAIYPSKANAQFYRRSRTESLGNFRRHAGYYPYRRFGYRSYAPVVTGSWYTRPYPQHLDYHRVRSNAYPVQQEFLPQLEVPSVAEPQ